MRQEIDTLVSKIKNYYRVNDENLNKAPLIRFLTNGGVQQLTNVYETWRISSRHTLIVSPTPPDTESLGYRFLDNTGDIFNGYLNSFLTYYAIGLLTPRLSDRIRSGISFIVGAGSIILVETRPTPLIMGRPDEFDIPAGIVGAVLFLGTNYVGRRLADRFVQRQINQSC